MSALEAITLSLGPSHLSPGGPHIYRIVLCWVFQALQPLPCDLDNVCIHQKGKGCRNALTETETNS